jgi:D-alanine transaminase
MPRITYVNGQYLPHWDAMVHVEDRGYQLADGVYEVIAIYNGQLIDNDDHMARLERSLSELRIDWPVNRRALVPIMEETIRRNHVRHGKLYLQITRGVAPRDHAFPVLPVSSSLVIYASQIRWPGREKAKSGQSVITRPDIRWLRRDIKSVSLLPNVLGKQEAIDAGADDTWFIDGEGNVTEGTASNAWIVSKDGELITRPTNEDILAGITRKTLLRLIANLKLKLVERPFTVDEAKQAKEAFFTSTTALLRPVVKIDDTVIGNGEPGEISCRLIDGYYDYMERESGGAGH